MARIFAVGVGPGDPELLTRKAERILRQAPVVCAPAAGEGDSSYALTIVESLLDRSRQEVIVLVFPMRKDQEGLDAFWEEAAEKVASQVRKGRDVAFITIGDPFLYSTFLYLYRILRDRYPDIPVEVVPGVSSVTNAAVAAGIPLAAASERVAILPATFEDDKLRRTLLDFDTVVLMKVNRVFDRVYALLEDLGLDRNGAFVTRAGTADEKVVFDLASLVGKKLDYLSLLIVKK
ncbi:MAG: precorrin-2 C(20)-methyltransferase [Geobacteraceae bacterium]|nr:precorrin-2 C(20)-methyltransferase [Geobacteraceae bacterium]